MERVFSIKRFWRLLRWDMVANRHTAVVVSFLVMGLLAMVYLPWLVGVTANRDVLHFDEGGAERIATMGWTAIFAIAVAGPAMAGLPFGNRRKAMACMALPATQLEKFLSRYLLSTAGLVVVAVCAIAVADLVQMAVALLVTGGVKGSFWSVTADFAGRLFADGAIRRAFASADDVAYTVCVLLLLLATHAFFLLGGMFFRRWPVALTVLAFMLLAYLDGALGINLFKCMTQAISYSSLMAAVVLLLSLAAIAALYRLSYRLFCRMQITNHKWFNL